TNEIGAPETGFALRAVLTPRHEDLYTGIWTTWFTAPGAIILHFAGFVQVRDGERFARRRGEAEKTGRDLRGSAAPREKGHDTNRDGVFASRQDRVSATKAWIASNGSPRSSSRF